MEGFKNSQAAFRFDEKGSQCFNPHHIVGEFKSWGSGVVADPFHGESNRSALSLPPLGVDPEQSSLILGGFLITDEADGALTSPKAQRACGRCA